MYSPSSNFSFGVNTSSTTQLSKPLLNLSANTTYYWRVRGSNSAGSSPWSTVWSFTTEAVFMDVSDLELEKIAVYPNPVQDFLYINLGVTANYQLNILNLQGQIIDSYQLDDSELMYDTSKLVAGIYFVEIIKEDKMKSLKFIKN